METSAASVSRTGSFRKRALEERTSLDMDVDLLPSKHERAPGENEMDASANSNTVQDEIEAHFQRSLAQAKSGGPPLTPSHTHTTHSHTHTTHSQPPHSHQPTEKHARVTTSPTAPTHPDEHESHRIVVTLNNHASSTLDHSTRQSPTTTLANGLQTNLPVRPVPKTSSTSFATPRNTQRFSPPSGGSPVSTSVHTLPMLTIPSVNSDSGGTILSPALTPQLVQQFMAQQSLSFLQEQQKQQRQNHAHQQQQGYTKINPNPNLVPNLVALNQNSSSKGLQIIDLTKNQLVTLPTQVQRSNQSQSLPKPHPNVVYVSKDGTQVTPLVTMGTGNIGGPLRVLNPSGAQLNPRTKVINKAASSTLVTATTTQPTPAVTTSLISNPQLVGGQGFSSMMVPMIDPNTSQIMTGIAGGNQILFLSAPPVVQQQQQPVVLINPNDLSTLQQMQTGGLPPGINLLNSGFALPNASGGPGYIILSPGQNSPSFAPPLINMAQTTGASPIITMAMQNSSPPPLTATPPPLTKTNRASRTKIPSLDPPQRRTSLDSISPGAEDNDDVMMTPASVEDHFAKALGDQWSKLQTGNDFNGHPRSVQTAQT